MSTEEQKVITGSQTVDRALSLLECFSAERPSLYLYHLSRQTGLTTPTTHPQCGIVEVGRQPLGTLARSTCFHLHVAY
jgi:hypothetical protein